MNDAGLLDPELDAIQAAIDKSVPGKSARIVSMSADRSRMLLIIDRADSPGALYFFDVNGTKLQRVAFINEALGTKPLNPVKMIQYQARDGLPIEAVLTLPRDRPAKSLPVIMLPHGGPWAQDTLAYDYWAQFLASRGYAVIQPNFRGSTGYGTAFIRDIIGHYFNNMHLDVIAGVDALVAQGIADPDRLAVAGWSAGAHLVNKLVTVTDRFKAASSGAGVANWISMMAQTDALTRRESWFGGSPWEKNAPIDLYVKQSPITDISRAKTPTLLFAGERDSRVPMAQALEMYRGLQDNNVPTKLVIGKDEEHDWTGGPLRQQFEKANTELAWYEKYVMSRDYRPEPYPGDAPPAP